ncbi:MAG: hypothetical protein EA356_16800 [Geminicoccaceae bacterium]|nr:MAG: hypothetical protein EA356_16800 [Geminicoccaceae bacterium]
MLEFVLAIAVKAVATGAFVLAMAVLIERAPPLVAAASIGFPVVVGPGFFLVALQQPTPFLTAAAANAVLTFVATLVFMVVIGRGFARLGVVTLLLCGCGAWAVTAFAVTHSTLELPWSLLLFAAAFAASHLILPFTAEPAPAAAKAPGLRRRPPFGRAIQAGLFVALVTYAADALGERVTAALLTMPVAMMFLTVELKQRVEADVGERIFRWGRMGLVALMSFVLTIHLTAAALGNVPATLLAFLVSIVVAIGLVVTERSLSTLIRDWAAKGPGLGS